CAAASDGVKVPSKDGWEEGQHRWNPQREVQDSEKVSPVFVVQSEIESERRCVERFVSGPANECAWFAKRSVPVVDASNGHQAVAYVEAAGGPLNISPTKPPASNPYYKQHRGCHCADPLHRLADSGVGLHGLSLPSIALRSLRLCERL